MPAGDIFYYSDVTSDAFFEKYVSAERRFVRCQLLVYSQNQIRGYTLFELLVVLAIIAFAAMMAPAAFSLVRHDFEITKLAETIQGEFRLARSRAILDNEMVATPVEVVSRRLRLGADWYDLPKGVSIEVRDRNLAAGADNAAVFYPDGSSSGFEIRIRGKKTTRLVATGLNGKTTISTVPD